MVLGSGKDGRTKGWSQGLASHTVGCSIDRPGLQYRGAALRQGGSQRKIATTGSVTREVPHGKLKRRPKRSRASSRHPYSPSHRCRHTAAARPKTGQGRAEARYEDWKTF